MTVLRAIVFVACGSALGGCRAIDDFGPFRVGLSDGSDGASVHDFAPVRDLAPMCVETLSGIEAGDFTISMTVTASPSPGRYQPFANQRTSCDVTQSFWDVGMAPDGTVLAHTNGRGGLATIYSTDRVDDDKPHRVNVIRHNGLLSISIDDRFNGETSSISAFGSLPPLAVGSGTYCDLGTATNVTVTDVCITAGVASAH